MLTDIFLVPVKDKVLLHAPLHGISAIINQSGAQQLHAAFNGEKHQLPETYQALLRVIKERIPPPQPRKGTLKEPRFLGLLPTRDCNMRCRYCDFPVSREDPLPAMTQDQCRDAIDAYYNLLITNGYQRAAIHFFGGEPFFEPELVFFAAEYARVQALKLDLPLHLEASSNGLMENAFATWISETFDYIVLSLDGRDRIQNYQRPAKGNQDSYNTVVETAKILSDSPCTLILRSCITQDSLSEMLETVEWMVDNFVPETICLEPMSESDQSIRNQLHTPDPWQFSKLFLRADTFLRTHGINCMLSTADLSLTTVSSCPVGHDALIVSPNGEINACYLPETSWISKGKDMHLGRIKDGKFNIQQANLDRIRSYELGNQSLCKNCFCRYHCAGGCHVNHPSDSKAGSYDAVCIRTRLVTIGKILQHVNQEELLNCWLNDDDALEKSALWRNDRIEAYL
ncbi:MAG: radical SAM protein [Chloroflexota bacterium]|nr:radical SAM protein [Chloroflexota bacterium]